MKLSIPQLNLAALIARGGAVAQKNAPIPVLSHVRLIAADNLLRLASTDQDRFAEGETPADVAEAGSCTTDADAFRTLIGKHPKTATVTLELADGRLVVSCGRSKAKLPTLPADTFPAWADEKADATFSLAGDDFERGFNRVRFAACADVSRPNLQGVHIDAHDGRLHFVATDGHRLAVSGMVAPAEAAACPAIIIPSEAVDAVLRVFKGVPSIAVAANKKSISFKADSLRLSCRLIDSTFPDYSRVVPTRGEGSVMTVRRADLADCLDRARAIAESEGSFSAITAKPDGDALRIEAANQRGGQAFEEMPAVIGDGFVPFGFNPKYAVDFLSALNVGDISIEQTGPANPHLIYSDDAPDFVGVLMPVRI